MDRGGVIFYGQPSGSVRQRNNFANYPLTNRKGRVTQCYTVSQKNMNETSMLTVRVPKVLKAAILAAAKAEDLSVSQFIRRHFAKGLIVRRATPRARKGAPV